MPNVYKSVPVELLDGFFASGSDLRENLRSSRALLRGNQSLADITAGLGSEHPELVPISDEADKFEEFWLEPLSNQGVEAVMRRAYRQAVERAINDVDVDATNLTEEQLSRLKPIETFWITGAGSAFEMHVCNTDARVIVFVITPIEREYPGSKQAHSQSWSFRARDDDVEIEQVSGETAPPEAS